MTPVCRLLPAGIVTAIAAFGAVAHAGAQQPAEPSGWRFDVTPRPSLRFGDTVRIDFRCKLQVDWRTFDPAPDDPPDGEDVEMGRLGMEGELTRFLEFELERELADAEDPWRNVWLNVRPRSAAQVRFGQFKVPFGRSRLEGGTNLPFVMRPAGVRVIAPGYDRGATLHGRVLARRVNYAVGYFRGARDRAAPDTYLADGWVAPDGLWAWRVTARPFPERMRAWRGLEVGVNGARSEVSEGRNNLDPEAVFGGDFFGSVYIRGARRRFGVDGAYTRGPLALQAEYLVATDERLAQGVADEDLPDFRLRDWYAHATYVVLGGSAASKDRPRAPLFRGGIGAVEVGGRVERFVADSAGGGVEPLHNPRAANVAGNGDTIWTLGVNWFPNRWIRLQWNSVREAFDDASRTLKPPETTFWSHVLRVQFVL